MTELLLNIVQEKDAQGESLVALSNEAIASGTACPIEMKDEILGELQPYLSVVRETQGQEVSVDLFVADPLSRNFEIKFNTVESGSQEISENDRKLQQIREEMSVIPQREKPYFANKLDRYDYQDQLSNAAAQKARKTPFVAMKVKQSRKMRYYSA